MCDRLPSVLLRSIVGLGFGALIPGCPCPCEDGQPTVFLTDVPALGSLDTLRGETRCVSSEAYRVVVYICVDGTWWIKPTAAQPLTAIASNCSWEVDITTGGDDPLADTIRAFVVPATYESDLHSLPSCDVAIASATAARGPTTCPGEVPCPLVAGAGDDAIITWGDHVPLHATVTSGRAPYTFEWLASGVPVSADQDALVSPSETTTYTLQVTDSEGQTATDTVTIVVRCPTGLSLPNEMLDGSVKSINFSPTDFDPTVGKYPTEDQLRTDLVRLYDGGFRGILLYDVTGTLAQVPMIAKNVGFQVIGVGIWNINEASEIDTGVDLADYASFYIVGSEGLFASPSRYSLEELEQRVNEVRNRTCKPVTTAEPWDVVLAHPDVITMVDFVAVNIYPWWEGAHDPQDAIDVLIEHYGEVQNASGGKAVIVRETGFPTCEHPDATVCQQQLYFELLERESIPFVYFEAFDQYWKHERDDGYDIGICWGLYDQDRIPKKCTPPELTGSCCIAENCSITTQATCSGGWTEGVSCAPNPCLPPTGSCCVGGSCSTTTQASCSGTWTQDGSCSPNLCSLPEVEFTHVPAIGSIESLEGTTAGVDDTIYRIVVYIMVDGEWWVKPYADLPLTTIREDGTWTCDITTGGRDPQASEIRAFVVSNDYGASLHTLPAESDFIAWIGVVR